MKDIIFLRPHHALCSQFFIGHGYSKEFTENMTALMCILNEQNLKVKFVGCCDDICSCCPKNIEGRCINETKVQETDKFCISEYGFYIGEELLWDKIKAKVINRIISQKKLPYVCISCQWLSICQNTSLLCQ